MEFAKNSRLQSPVILGDIQLVKDDVIFVISSLNGMGFGVHVVVTGFDCLQEMLKTRKNFLKPNPQKKGKLLSMVCRGLCTQYKAKWGFNQFRYAEGQKRCNSCDIFIEWDGFWCPCCGRSLRTRPRTSKYKKIFYEKNDDIEKITTK